MARFLFRATALIAVAIFGAVAVWLLWADRGTIIGDRIVRGVIEAGQAFERHTSINVVDRADVPFAADSFGHAVLWATGMLVIGWFFVGRRPLPLVMAQVGALSLFSEFAQPLVSTRRGVEMSDAVANLIGVGIGGLLLGIAVGSWKLAVVSRRDFGPRP